MKLSLSRKKKEVQNGKPSPGKVVEEPKTLVAIKKTSPGETVLRPAAAAEFAAMVAREIVKNLSFSNLRLKPFARDIPIASIKDIPAPDGENLILVDTSVLIDGRILPIVNSGFRPALACLKNYDFN